MQLEVLVAVVFLVILVWETTHFMLRKKNIKLFLPIMVILLLALFKFIIILLGGIPFAVNLVIHMGYFIALSSYFFIIIDSKKQKQVSIHKVLSVKLKKALIIGIDVIVILLFAWLVSVAIFKDHEPISDELYVYDWGDYFAPGILEEFEDEFGIKIHVDMYDDEYDMYQSLVNGAEYDFAFASDALLPTLVEEDLVQPIRTENLFNIGNLGELSSPESDQVNGIAYTWGTTGIVYNTAYVKEINSWDVFWNSDYSHRLGLLDSPDEVIGMINKFSRGKLLPTTTSQIASTKEFLELTLAISESKSDLELIDGMISEDLWIAHMYNGGAAVIMEENANVKYVLPEEGYLAWVDQMIIPASSDDRATAELFIDYLLRPEVAARIVNYQYYASANEQANKYISKDILNDESIYVPESEFENIEFLSDYVLTEEYSKLRKYVHEKLENDR